MCLEMVSKIICSITFPDWGQSDLPTVPQILLLTLLEDRRDIFFLPVIRNLPWSPQQFKDNRQLSHNDIGQLPHWSSTTLPGFLACGEWTVLEFGRRDPWKSTHPLGALFSPRQYPTESLQADPWTGQSLPSWSPGLWSSCLPCSLLSGSWTPPPHCHCIQGCPWPSHPLLLLPCLQV